MKNFLSKHKVNKLTFSFIITIVSVTVLAFTVSLSLGYYNINSVVDRLFKERVTNDQMNVVDDLYSIDSKINLATYQIISDQNIKNILTSSSEFSPTYIRNASLNITTYTTDLIGYVNMYIVNTKNDKIFTRRLVPKNYIDSYIDREDFLKKCHNKETKYIAPNDENYVILTSYDMRGFAIAYIFEKNVLFDSICDFNADTYKTTVFYEDKLFLTNNYNNTTISLDSLKNNEHSYTVSSGNYTILTEINPSTINSFYEPYIRQIFIFSIVIILIGIMALILSVKVFGKTSENYINNLLSHSLQYQYAAIKSTIQKSIRTHYLQQSDEDAINEYFNKSDYSNLYCCLVKLDNLNTMLLSYSYKNIAMNMQKIKLIFENCLSSLGVCIILDIDFDTIGIILAAKEPLEAEDFDKALTSARADIDRLLAITVSIATTNPLVSHTEIYNTFIHLEQLMKYRFFSGYNSTITEKDEINNTQIYPIAKQQQIITHMLSHEIDKFKFLLIEFFEDAKKINCDDAKKWILDLSMALLKHYPSTEGAVEMISLLSRAETIDEQFEILKQHFIDTAPETDTNITTGDSFLARVNDIIESEYHNLDFNLSSLSDSLGISSVYAGKKFKTVFEKSFTSYLAEFRIHKAIEMMQNSDLTSSEISERCGFSSATYFIKTFKKITNMTPSEYKRTM